jgi:hypothetical protein
MTDRPYSTAPPSSPPTAGAQHAVEHDRIEAAHAVYEKGEVSSIGALVADITADLSTLMRQEVELAKAELRDSATHAAKGAGMMGGAGVAAHFAVLFLTLALWWAIGTGIHSRAWAAVIVAVLWAIVAAVLAAMGRRDLKGVQGVPRTVETAKKVPDALKGNEDQG